MVFMPPRHGKSQLVSIQFPAWYLGRNPEKQFMAASYSARLASSFGRRVRNLLAERRFANVFPDVALAPDSKARDEWHTRQGGVYVAAGVGGSITGKGADVLSIDDPVKGRADAESETLRDNAWDWYTGDAYPRLMDGGSIILTMTRWHEDDLAGRILNQAAETGDSWDILCLPAIDAEGKALWPERYGIENLKIIQRNIGPRDFASLYQQDPQPPGSAYFDVANILIDGQPAPDPAWVQSVYAVMDTAVKTGTKNDGTGVTFFAKLEDGTLRILDWDIVQIEGDLLISWLPQIFERLQEFAVHFKAVFGSLGVFVEDKASGTILLQQARRRGWPAHEIDSGLTSVGKDERAISVSGYVYQQKIKMLASAYEKRVSYKGNYANQFIRQVFGFRLGVKDQQDDLLDTFTYGISLALGNAEGY